MTSLDRVRSISVSGLTPKNGDNSKTVNDEKVKVFFSEGMTGAVALYADLQKHYDDIKAGNTGKTPADRVEAVNATTSLEEYLGGDGVYFLFDGTDVENEKNFISRFVYCNGSFNVYFCNANKCFGGNIKFLQRKHCVWN